MEITVKHEKNIFTESELNSILNNIFSIENESKWSINKHFWKDDIKNKSPGTVSIFRIEGKLREFIEDILKKYLEPDEIFQFIQYYEWNPMSQINWHNDSNKKAAITIYLNETWDPNDGGFFCWQENAEKAHLIVPEFNSAVIVRGNPPHHVSLINPFAPVRKTLQIWITSKSVK